MQDLIAQLPYKAPFLFVDKIQKVDENSIEGTYKFAPELDFYKGHFKDNPVTPGVILTECMAQIGVVTFGIYLLQKQESISIKPNIALTSSDIEYLKPVFPGEEVKVHSEKEYFRFGKLKCRVKMFNSKNELVCRGKIAGMILKEKPRG